MRFPLLEETVETVARSFWRLVTGLKPGVNESKLVLRPLGAGLTT
jgi:hypothetical protein